MLNKQNTFIIILVILFLVLLLLFLYFNKRENYYSKQKEEIEKEEIRNVFIYWIGKEYKLIKILRNLIFLHSLNGKGYKVHFINKDNVNQYIKNLPSYFDKLLPAHQADFIRVNVVCDYGGIWLDSDTLVLDKLDSLFDIFENENKDGFFIKQNNEEICNGVFGSKKQTPIMIEWKKKINEILERNERNDNKENLGWTELGGHFLQNMYLSNPSIYDNYIIYKGLDNVYPVNWTECVTEFLDKPYSNYKNIVRDFQPFIILVNSVYKKLEDENKTIKEIIEGNNPLGYFINKSFENLNIKSIENIDKDIDKDIINFYKEYKKN